MDLQGVELGEAAVSICGGRELLCFSSFEAEEEGTSHVRFVDAGSGNELLHYTVDEWVEDPKLVMGCIMAAIQNGAGSHPDLARKAAEDTPLARVLAFRAKHGVWSEYPRWSREDWAAEVANKDTNQGYWEWVIHEMEVREGE